MQYPLAPSFDESNEKLGGSNSIWSQFVDNSPHLVCFESIIAPPSGKCILFPGGRRYRYWPWVEIICVKVCKPAKLHHHHCKALL